MLSDASFVGMYVHSVVAEVVRQRRAADFVLDVGAKIGTFSLPAARACRCVENLAIEPASDRAERAWCGVCGVPAVGHGRRRVPVRDLPVADRPVVLVWAKRLWRSPRAACAAGTWSEESDQIAPRAVLTERARAEIFRRVGPGEQSVARATRDFGGVVAHGDGRDVGSRPARVDHLARLGAPGARWPGREPGSAAARRGRHGRAPCTRCVAAAEAWLEAQ